MNKYLSNLISSPYLRLLCIPLFTYAFLLGVKAYAQEGPTAEHAVFVAVSYTHLTLPTIYSV